MILNKIWEAKIHELQKTEGFIPIAGGKTYGS